MDYGKLLKRAWYITGKNKFLWIFGMFSVGGSFFNGGGGSFNNDYSNKAGGTYDSTINIFEKAKEFIFENIFLISILTIVAILFYLFIFCIKSISHSSIVSGVNEIEEKGNSNFSNSFKLGLRYFWKVLTLNILSSLLLIIIVAALGLPVFMLIVLDMPLRGLLLGLLAFIILFPLVFIINFTTTYASRSIVVNDNKLFQAIKDGFEIFKNNILKTIFISLILFAINMGVTIILIIVIMSMLILFGIPIAIIVGIINVGAGLIGSIIMILLSILVIGLFMIFIGAILNTFQSTLWTLVYRELNMCRGSKF